MQVTYPGDDILVFDNAKEGYACRYTTLNLDEVTDLRGAVYDTLQAGPEEWIEGEFDEFVILPFSALPADALNALRDVVTSHLYSDRPDYDARPGCYAAGVAGFFDVLD